MKEGRWIRFALVALPAGLFVSGLASVIYTVFFPDSQAIDPNQKKFLEAASLNRVEINRADLDRSLSIISREIGERHTDRPEALHRASVWIESSFRGSALGYRLTQQTVPGSPDPGIELRNLIAELPGKSRPREAIALAVRYDSAPGSPGANGRGSGVAALLALARSFAGSPQDRTLRFVFLASATAAELYASEQTGARDTVVAALCLDSIGYFSSAPGSQSFPAPQPPGPADFLAMSAPPSARPWLDSAKISFQTASGMGAMECPWPQISDLDTSQAFSAAGIATVSATDTGPWRYPHHHQAGDTLENISLDQLEKVCRGIEAIVRHWANL